MFIATSRDVAVYHWKRWLTRAVGKLELRRHGFDAAQDAGGVVVVVGTTSAFIAAPRAARRVVPTLQECFDHMYIDTPPCKIPMQYVVQGE